MCNFSHVLPHLARHLARQDLRGHHSRHNSVQSSQEPLLTWQAAIQLMQKEMQAFRSANTWLGYRSDINKLSSWALEQNLLPQQVTNNDIKNFLHFQSSKAGSSRSLNRLLSAVRTFFWILKKYGFVEDDPVRNTKNFKGNQLLPKAFSTKEVKDFFGEYILVDVALRSDISFSNMRSCSLFALLYTTGARISEALSLNTSDLVKISTTNCVRDRVKIIGKGAKSRYLFFNQHMQTMLKDYLIARSTYINNLSTKANKNKDNESKNKENKDNEAIAQSQTSDSSPLFINLQGTRLTRRGAGYLLNQYLKKIAQNQKVGQTYVGKTLHSFRHSFATHLLNSGIDLRYVQEFLGHSSVSTTQVYTKLSQKEVVEAYKKFHPHA